MLRVDHERWSQSQADLRQLALGAGHARSRERFLALHDITQGACATEVAERTGRDLLTVMGWLHSCNERGPRALLYQRTGGRSLCPRIEAALGNAVHIAQQQAARPPLTAADPKPRWALRRLVGLVRAQFGRRCGRETLRAALQRLDLSWKGQKCRCRATLPI